MSFGKQRHIAPDCPGCGAPDAARMSSTRWGHDVSCCSDECGARVGEALNRMRATDEYKDAERRLATAQMTLRQIHDRTLASVRGK